MASTARDAGVVPDDCSRILPVGELVAVFGMPLDSVVVRTTVGVPAPSVGRLERMDCTYSGTAAAGPDSGRRLLAINAAAYTTPAAARAQWMLNAAIEDGVHRDQPVGTAPGVLVERPGEALLAVQYGSGTVTLDLPDRPLPRDAARKQPRGHARGRRQGMAASPRSAWRARAASVKPAKRRCRSSSPCPLSWVAVEDAGSIPRACWRQRWRGGWDRSARPVP